MIQKNRISGYFTIDICVPSKRNSFLINIAFFTLVNLCSVNSIHFQHLIPTFSDLRKRKSKLYCFTVFSLSLSQIIQSKTCYSTSKFFFLHNFARVVRYTLPAVSKAMEKELRWVQKLISKFLFTKNAIIFGR